MPRSHEMRSQRPIGSCGAPKCTIAFQLHRFSLLTGLAPSRQFFLDEQLSPDFDTGSHLSPVRCCRLPRRAS
eukprot:3354538-Pleurochrysis_carterae.AAC.3